MNDAWFNIICKSHITDIENILGVNKGTWSLYDLIWPRLIERDFGESGTTMEEYRYYTGVRYFYSLCNYEEIHNIKYIPNDWVPKKPFIYLDCNNIVTISNWNIPASVRTISLENNDIVDVIGWELPANIEDIYIGSNKIVDVIGWELPVTLTVLSLNNNNIVNIIGWKLQNINKLSLDLTGNPISRKNINIFIKHNPRITVIMD